MMIGAVLVLPGFAAARCMEGQTSVCTGANGCPGVRECLSGHISGCRCTQDPPCAICGRPSTKNPSGTCRPLAETCNACDDDLDGQVDEGLSGCLASGPFSPKCVATASPGVPVELGSMNERLPRTPDKVTYANNMRYTARVHTNALVQQFTAHYSERTVHVWDVFRARFGPTSTWTLDQHGLPGDAPLGIVGTGQKNGIDFEFTTNRTVDETGWWMDGAGVTCSAGVGTAPAASEIPVLDEDAIDTYATLIASDDVVFFQLPSGPDPISIWLDGKEVNGTLDADLYVRYDSPPTRDQYTFVSRRAGPDEFVAIDTPIAGRTLFVAVHSKSGSGTVNVRFARSRRDQLYVGNPIRVGFLFAATPNDKAQARKVLQYARDFVFGLTEGKVQLRRIDFYENDVGCFCPGGCHVCLNGTSGRSYYNTALRHIALAGSAWRFDVDADQRQGSRTLGHEWGHQLLGLEDEYRDHWLWFDVGCNRHGDTTCSATAMGRHWSEANLCNTFDHGLEGSPAGHTCSTCPRPINGTLGGQSCAATTCNACFATGASSWERLVSGGKVLTRPTMTPNAVTYQGFAFPSPVFQIVTR